MPLSPQGRVPGIRCVRDRTTGVAGGGALRSARDVARGTDAEKPGNARARTARGSEPARVIKCCTSLPPRRVSSTRVATTVAIVHTRRAMTAGGGNGSGRRAAAAAAATMTTLSVSRVVSGPVAVLVDDRYYHAPPFRRPSSCSNFAPEFG